MSERQGCGCRIVKFIDGDGDYEMLVPCSEHTRDCDAVLPKRAEAFMAATAFLAERKRQQGEA